MHNNSASAAQIKTKCEICDSLEYREVYKEKLSSESFTPYSFSARRLRRNPVHYQIVKCVHCGSVRSNNIVPESLANSLYKESQYLYQKESYFAAKTYLNLFKSLAGNLSSKQKILEVGCGNGSLLKELFDAGVTDVVGVEPSAQSIAHADNKIRSKIIHASFRAESFENNYFDFILCFHLIDHLYSPKEFLEGCRRILKPGGSILIVSHDAEAWSAKLFRDRSPIFDVEHVYLFEKRTLNMLLEKIGFNVCRAGDLINTYPLSYWLKMSPYLNYFSPYLRGKFMDFPVSLKAGNIYSFANKPL